MILDMEGHFVSDTVAPVRQPKVLGRFLMVDFLISSSILDKTKIFPQTPKFNMCFLLLERNMIYISNFKNLHIQRVSIFSWTM